jgi:Ca2+-binding EF-hand superfamily protein
VPQQRRPSLQRRQTRLLRKDSRAVLSRRRSSTLSDLVAEFVLEGEEFSGFEASKWALHNRFGIGSLKGVDAYRIWKKVFEVLKVDGEVHHTDLRRALEMAGFQKPDQECIDAAKLKVTQWSTLSAAQFNEFAIHFGTEMEKLQDRMFVIFDTDNSGEIDRGELECLLQHFGVIPMRHVLDEVLREVDEDHSGNVGLDEFRKAFDILRLREGFSKQEFQDLTDLFKKLDLDGSGEMDKREVTVVLGYLDYRLDADERDRIMAEVDTDGSGELSEFEFPLFMRRCRQIEMRKLTDAFNNVDPEADGVICFGQLLVAFTQLGYEPDPDATWEAAEAVGISSKEANLDTSDFWQVLTECREREWFFTAELDQISAAFEQVDPENHGEIEIAQIDKALLAVGLSLRSDLLLYLVGKVDLDCSGLLSQMEFRKLVRIYQIGQAQLVRATFEDFLDPDSYTLGITDSWKAFTALGFVTDSVNDSNRVRAMGNLDFKAFLREVKTFEKEQQLFRQNNSGFSEQACLDLAKRFEQFDTDNSGALESRELVALIEELLPGVATAPENRPTLMKMMEEAQGRSGTLTDTDKLALRVAGVRSSHRSSALPSATRLNSSQTELDFQQFLKLLSLVRVFKLDQIVQKEERVIEECDLSIVEVQQFRELFLENASGDGCMTMKDLLFIIGNVCPLGDRNKAELHEHIKQVVSCTSRDHDITITFAELMMLMGRLRDANFGGIRDKFFS